SSASARRGFLRAPPRPPRRSASSPSGGFCSRGWARHEIRRGEKGREMDEGLMRRDGARPVVVVTGASAGVGRATSRAFARRGARLGLLARDRARLEKTKREVERLGGEAIVLVADVADSDAVDAAARDVE